MWRMVHAWESSVVECLWLRVPEGFVGEPQKNHFSVANMAGVPPGVGRDSLWVWEERVSLHCTIKKKDAVAALEVRVVGEHHMELDNQVSQLLQGDK